jgi:hypothetical protein
MAMSYSRGDFVHILASSSTNLPRRVRKIEDAGPKTCYGQGLTSNPVGKLIPMETAMHDINGALNLLKAGHSIQRPGSNMKGTSYFLKNENGKEWLYVRQTRVNSSEVIEEPTAFDWDDLTATWEVVETTSNK